eukprot:3026972-Rhodomonas_salina.2
MPNQCPGFVSNSECAVAGIINVPTFICSVMKQQCAFDDKPDSDVWETISHFKVNFLLNTPFLAPGAGIPHGLR